MAKRGPSWRYALKTDQDIDALFGGCLDLEDRIILILTTRLGMRAEEATHMQASWIERDVIRIPPYQPCRCSDCRRPKKKKPGGNWYAKTERSVRDLAIGDSIAGDITQYFSEHLQGLCMTRQALWQRVKRIARRAKMGNRVFPHALRATAATTFIRKGMTNPAVLCNTMGWDRLSTAERYINLTVASEMAQKQQRDILK